MSRKIGAPIRICKSDSSDSAGKNILRTQTELKIPGSVFIHCKKNVSYATC